MCIRTSIDAYKTLPNPLQLTTTNKTTITELLPLEIAPTPFRILQLNDLQATNIHSVVGKFILILITIKLNALKKNLYRKVLNSYMVKYNGLMHTKWVIDSIWMLTIPLCRYTMPCYTRLWINDGNNQWEFVDEKRITFTRWEYSVSSDSMEQSGMLSDRIKSW